ncbi:MAG TPA: phosphoribosyltransferase family protein [Candidatus Saccharimonadales bacterium]|nr:phosphoribosyltransferase family protein [Candidatus Saccharimonadales bacterium]
MAATFSPTVHIGTETQLTDGGSKLTLNWEEMYALALELADGIEQHAIETGESFDVMAVLPRGGYFPALILSRRFGFRAHQIVHLGLTSYRDGETQRSDEIIGQTPNGEEIAGRNVLLVDEVCDSGHTLMQATHRLARLGAHTVRSAVLHYKPERSETGYVPDIYAASYNGWVVYPGEPDEAHAQFSCVNRANHAPALVDIETRTV